MDIQDLESYYLFQEINDRLLVLSSFIKKSEDGLAVKDTFSINKTNQVIVINDKSEEDVKVLLKWIENEIFELVQKMKECITLTNQNYTKFKSENPTIKEEVKTREKELKKAIKYLDEIVLDPLTYDKIQKLKQGPDINSDYAGISVVETKHFLM